MDRNVYFGPWIAFKEERITKKRSTYGCPKDCYTHLYGGGKYCPNCGSPMVIKEEDYQDRKVDPDDAVEAVQNSLRAINWSAEDVFFIPNESRGKESPLFDYGDGEFIAVSSNREKMMTWFVEGFKGELIALQKLYGQQGTIDHGLLKWES